MARTIVPVKSGELRDSIVSDESNMERLEISVGSNKEYAAVIELGGHNRPAQPFLGQSAEQAASQIPFTVKSKLDRSGL